MWGDRVRGVGPAPLFLLLMREPQGSVLLESELCIGCGCAEELLCDGEPGRAVQGGDLTQLFGGEGSSEGSAAGDDGDVAHGGAVDDVEHKRVDVVLCEGCRRGQLYVQPYVSQPDYGEVLNLMDLWGARNATGTTCTSGRARTRMTRSEDAEGGVVMAQRVEKRKWV